MTTFTEQMQERALRKLNRAYLRLVYGKSDIEETKKEVNGITKELITATLAEVESVVEGIKEEYPVDAQPNTPEHEIRINWANPVVHQALDTIKTRIGELVGKKEV